MTISELTPINSSKTSLESNTSEDSTCENQAQTLSEASIELLVLVVPRGRAELILHYIQHHYHCDASVIQGHGTRPSKLCQFLGINEVHREILMVMDETRLIRQISEDCRKHFHLDQPGKGIGYTIALSKPGLPQSNPEYTSYVCLFCILDTGLGAEALTVASKMGAGGGTFMVARGGAERTNLHFPFLVESEKEVLMILIPRDDLEKIQDALHNHFSMEKENTGIQFSFPLTSVFGLYQQEV